MAGGALSPLAFLAPGVCPMNWSVLLLHSVAYAVSHVSAMHSAAPGSGGALVHAAHHRGDRLGLPPTSTFGPDSMDVLFGTKPAGQPLGADSTYEAVCAGGAVAAALALVAELLRRR